MGRYGNRNAKKVKRKIEIGWLLANWNGHCSRQVRKKTGGGTRKISIDKHSTKEDILKIAKDLFFPNGKSYHDDLPDLENNVTYIDQSGLSNLKNPLTVIDIDDIPIDPDDTVQFGPFPSSDKPQDLSETIPTTPVSVAAMSCFVLRGCFIMVR
ncbi:hypothetical protein ACJMK2_009485 [Sinanodonta woodiana]|uniref:Uncharacterized protein n=1 Tax=Sinanodonta woodiana TaxID=1069815 RepID=A0ABD3VFB7_SINWO